MWQARSGKQGAAVATGSKRDSKERGAARAALLKGSSADTFVSARPPRLSSTGFSAAKKSSCSLRTCSTRTA